MQVKQSRIWQQYFDRTAKYWCSHDLHEIIMSTNGPKKSTSSINKTKFAKNTLLGKQNSDRCAEIACAYIPYTRKELWYYSRFNIHNSIQGWKVWFLVWITICWFLVWITICSTEVIKLNTPTLSVSSIK